MVEPDLKYFNNTWGKCGTTLTSKFQTLLNRAARIITYENTGHTKSLNWLNVSQLIDFDIASLMYKTEGGLAPAHLKQMFVKSEDLLS